MSDEPKLVDFNEWLPGAQGKPPKRKSKPAPTPESDPDLSDKENARLAASLVADSTRLNEKSIEDIAEMAIRRMANAILLGGEAFLPTSLNEATNSAKAWTSIASSERARLGGKGIPLDADDAVNRQLRGAVLQLRKIQKAPE